MVSIGRLVLLVSRSCFLELATFIKFDIFDNSLSQVASNQPGGDGGQGMQPGGVADMEDFGVPQRPLQPAIPISTKRKRLSQEAESQAESQELELTQSWREILGPPPPSGTTRVGLPLPG